MFQTAFRQEKADAFDVGRVIQVEGCLVTKKLLVLVSKKELRWCKIGFY